MRSLRYARGRDYHKVLRERLQKLCDRIAAEIGPFGYRVFTDSAPVMEGGARGARGHRLARQAHAAPEPRRRLVVLPGRDLLRPPLPVDEPEKNSLRNLRALHRRLPDAGDPRPYQLDARRCISYLTIEHKSAIPEELRPLIGNRVYGCDDCQLVCPWNRFAQLSPEKDFQTRNGLDNATLVELFAWTEAEFDERLRGSPIRRIGYERWLRNLAVGLGNAPSSPSGSRAAPERKTIPPR